MLSGAGGTAGRVMAVRAVVLCSSGETAATVSAGPLGLVLWSDACDDVDGAMGVYRGTIAGNVALVAVACAVVLGAALYVSWSQRASMLAGLRRVAFPSTLLPVWVVVLPSTATSVAQVTALSTGCAGDVVCVLAGLTLVCAPLAALVWIAWWIPSHAVATKVVTKAHIAPAVDRSWTARAAWRVRSVLRPMWRWTPNGAAASSKGSVEEIPSDTVEVERASSLRHCVVVLQDYRSVWYAVLDDAVLVVVGTLVAVSGHGPAAQCVASVLLVALCYAVQLVACAALRPFTTLLGVGYALFTLSFTLLGAVIQLSMFAVSGSASTASLLMRLSLAASIWAFPVPQGVDLQVQLLLDENNMLKSSDVSSSPASTAAVASTSKEPGASWFDNAPATSTTEFSAKQTTGPTIASEPILLKRETPVGCTMGAPLLSINLLPTSGLRALLPSWHGQTPHMALCDVVTIGASFVRSLVDAHDLARELCLLLGCGRLGRTDDDAPRLEVPDELDEDDEADACVPALPVVSMEALFDDLENVSATDGTEHLFWDAEGDSSRS